jgi:uncharacterized protein DUF6484
MKTETETQLLVEVEQREQRDSFADLSHRPVLQGRGPVARDEEIAGALTAPASAPPTGSVVGELIGMTEDGHKPLVVYRGQPGTAALLARSVVDLHSQHIGREVVLAFEANDLRRPIIMGILRDGDASGSSQQVGQIDIIADDARLVVTAREQLVLRCGGASITLTSAGKVLIQGSYILSRSSGVNRVKGGSIQLN